MTFQTLKNRPKCACEHGGFCRDSHICYTFGVSICSGHCRFIVWECHTCQLFCGGLQSCFTTFLVSCVLISEFWSTVLCSLTKKTRFTKNKAIVWLTCLLECVKCTTLNAYGDPFTQWSLSNETKSCMEV